MKPVSVISLTPAGRDLAARLRPHLNNAEYLHRPRPFRDTVQGRFRVGHRLVLICATGIAVRTLAPVLGNKHSDPAVLVLDEAGRFVIPLLSGHEGGANDWADRLSRRIGARCVITSARTYTSPILVAGMGCEQRCPMESLADLMESTLAGHDLEASSVSAIASIDLKRNEPGLLQLAERLEIPAFFYPAATLLRYTKRLSRISELVYRETGCYGVAEAAALSHAERMAGQRAELLIVKQKNARATFALARAYPLNDGLNEHQSRVGDDRNETQILD
jgi:cobalt-precorrin 5A hydrolase